MTTTYISLVNNVVSITVGDGRSRQYYIQSANYAFNERDELVLEINNHSYSIPIANLRIAGSGTAPANAAAAMTALSSVFPNAGGSATPTYLVYTALLTQTGTSAPVATVLENTLSGTVVWTYSAVGSYIGTLTGEFIASKTTILVGGGDSAGGNAFTWNVDASTKPDSINLNTFDKDSGVPANDLLYETTIEIRVYP